MSDPTTWGSFDQARAIAEAGRCAGVGFVFTDSDPFVGVDLDVSEGAGPSEGQRRIYEAFNTYAEQSPSARGLHTRCCGPARRTAPPATRTCPG